jgi:hypothetical protein
MGAEACTIRRAEAVDFLFDCWAVEVPSDECVKDMRKTLDWNLSRISMLEVEAVPQSCIP